LTAQSEKAGNASNCDSPKSTEPAQGFLPRSCLATTNKLREEKIRIGAKLFGSFSSILWDDTATMSVTLNIDVVRKKLFGDDE
jgi:hypothetical protein